MDEIGIDIRGQSSKDVMTYMGRRHYWFAATPLIEPEEGPDRWAVEHGCISLTPLRLNLTDEERLERLMQRDLPDASAGA